MMAKQLIYVENKGDSRTACNFNGYVEGGIYYGSYTNVVWGANEVKAFPDSKQFQEHMLYKINTHPYLFIVSKPEAAGAVEVIGEHDPVAPITTLDLPEIELDSTPIEPIQEATIDISKLDDLPKLELQDICTRLGLSTEGVKAVLADRIRTHASTQD